LRKQSRKSRIESGGKVVLDTSFIIELLDRGRKDLVYLLAEYDEIIIPWISLYEYLYGHKVGRKISEEELAERKRKIESLGIIDYGSQKLIEKALKLELELTKKGKKIPFSDLLIAAYALLYNADLATLDKTHFEFLKNRLVP